MDAASFRSAAQVLGGTHNDALLASVSGALRRWLSGAGLRVPATLRAFCPVNLRRSDEEPGRGNRISLWMVDLPLGVPDLRSRIEHLRDATRRHKRRGDARGGVSVARLAERLGTWVSTAGMAVAAFRRAFHLVVTNVPGPSRPLHLLGAELESLVPFAPLFPGQRVAVAVVSYAGRLHVGVNDGWQGRAPGNRFATDLREALADVCAEAEVAGRVPVPTAGVA